MKVLILHPPLYPMNHRLFEELGKYVELVVYCFGEHPMFHKDWLVKEFQNEAKNYKIVIVHKGITSFKKQFNFQAFMGLIKEKPDIVISVAFWIPSVYSSLLRKILNFKFIIMTDAITITEQSIKKSKLQLRKLICDNTDVVIAASDLTIQYIQTLSSKVVIKKSLQTVDINYWKKSLIQIDDKDKLRKALNLPIDKTILLSVGNFFSLKNWESVLEEMQFLEDFHYILIGSGELEKSYALYIQENNLNDKVSLLSSKNGIELIRYFKASDIFMFPSFRDTFGYVVPEALISGLPVICSSQAGASSLIENGFNGYVINPNLSFQKEIELVQANLTQMSANAIESISRCTLENRVNEFYTIFKNILKVPKNDI